MKTMMSLLTSVEKEFIPHWHPLLGEGILKVTDIISSPYPGASVIPDRCRVTFGRRLLVNGTKEGVLKQIKLIIRGVTAFEPRLKAEVFLAVDSAKCYTGEVIKAERFAPGWVSGGHPFVQKALPCPGSAGLSQGVSHYSFCTNGSYNAGEAGVPTVGFGHSLGEFAHVVEGYIEIDQLVAACRGMQESRDRFFPRGETSDIEDRYEPNDGEGGGPGSVLVLRGGETHEARGITFCRVIDAFCPARDDFR